MDTFIREQVDGGYRYQTAAGWYLLTWLNADAWVLAAASDGTGKRVGRYHDVPAAEAALEAAVRERMWA